MLRLICRATSPIHTQSFSWRINQNVRKEISKNNFSLIKLMLSKEREIDDRLRKVLKIRNHAEDNQKVFQQLANYQLKDLALCLEFIASVQRKIKNKIISIETYKKLTNTYFQAILSSNNTLVRPITRFIYLQNNVLRSAIKNDQINLIQRLADRKTMEPYQFSSVINNELFNITDMPRIYDLFYQIYFPSLDQLTTVAQLHQSLIYLSNFGKIPIFFPNKIIQILSQELQANPYIYYSHFLEMNNIIYLMLFRFPTTLQELGMKQPFENLHKKLIDKPIVDQQNRNSIQGIIQDQELAFLRLKCLNINQLIYSFQQRKSMLEEQTVKLDEALKIKLDQKNEDKLCINQILHQQVKNIQKLLDNEGNRLLHKTFLEFKIKQYRSLVLASTMPLSDPSLLYNFIADQKIFKLLKKNLCIPQFYKSLQIAQSRIKENGKNVDNINKVNFDKLFKSVKNKLDKHITMESIKHYSNQVVKSQQASTKGQTMYQAPFEETLWCSNQLSKVFQLHQNYDIKMPNIFYLLKNDPQFLLSLVKWNTSNFINNFYLDKQLKSQGFSTEPCKYTEGSGFKVYRQNQRKTIILKLQSQLNKNILLSGQDNVTFLRGGLKNMIKTLRRIKKSTTH